VVGEEGIGHTAEYYCVVAFEEEEEEGGGGGRGRRMVSVVGPVCGFTRTATTTTTTTTAAAGAYPQHEHSLWVQPRQKDDWSPWYLIHHRPITVVVVISSSS